MPRSHPPTLLTVALATIARAALFARGDRVLVAVSGGPDSMAMLHVLALLRKKVGHALVAHGVDHGLRSEAAGELDLAERFARSLDVPFGRTRVVVPSGGNLQARAREARYAALRTEASRVGASAIATAHHAQDRAETVLLRLLRGAGPAGLAVLPPRAGSLVRPLLDATRDAIDAHVARHEIPFARDPSNRDPRFLRVRVRSELLPLLRALSPQIDAHLCALAEQLGTISAATEPEPGVERLPRATRDALGELSRVHSPRARIALKNGRAARWDAARGAIVVEERKEAGGRVSPWRTRKSSP